MLDNCAGFTVVTLKSADLEDFREAILALRWHYRKSERV